MQRSRGRMVVVVAAVVAAAVIAAVLVLLPSGGAFATGPTLAQAYQVSYRQEIDAGDSHTIRYETLSVHRPYTGSDLTYDSPADRDPSSGVISTEDGLYDVRRAQSLLLVGGRQPGVASGDQDLITQMPELISRGLATDLHQSEDVAGHTCRVYRMAEPPSGPVKPLAGSPGHDDLCIAPGGLMLAEQWTLNGVVVLQRRALRVSLSAPPIPSVAGATTLPAGTGAATAKQVSAPVSFLAKPPPPSGFRARPIVQLILPSVFGAQVTGSVVWAFGDGAHTVSVEAGGPSQQPPWSDGDTVTRATRLKLGRATTAIRSDGAEVRVDLGDGSWIRVRGNVPVASLVAYADGLRRR